MMNATFVNLSSVRLFIFFNLMLSVSGTSTNGKHLLRHLFTYYDINYITPKTRNNQ